MISIQPKWRELIAIGKKTIEVRKTKPKLETPFKCYIYETKTKDHFATFHENTIGKVIGEFVCNNVDMFHYGVQTPYGATSYFDCYKGYSEELYEMEENHCLTKQEINDYGNNSSLYVWHISDLEIYDKPKELSEFYHERAIQCMSTEFNIEGVTHYPVKKKIVEPISRPPQSWCYCEELANG